SGLTGGEQFLGGEFRRGPQIARRACAVAADNFGAGSVQTRLAARRDLEDPGLHLGKALLVKPGPDRLGDRTSRQEKRLSIGVPHRRPPWRRLVGPGHQPQSPARRRGAVPTESINAFRESANDIDIIRLSLHSYGKPQKAARFRFRSAISCRKTPGLSMRMPTQRPELAGLRERFEVCFNAFGIGRRNRQVTVREWIVSR